MTSLVIDLCTPPASPRHVSRGHVDLCTPPLSPTAATVGATGGATGAATGAASDDDEAILDARLTAMRASVAILQDEEQKRNENKRKKQPQDQEPPAKVRRPALGPSSSTDTGASAMGDDEVLETAAPPALNKIVHMGKADDDDDEVQCTGCYGDNALMDFPHARENCCVVKFVQGQVPRTHGLGAPVCRVTRLFFTTPRVTCRSTSAAKTATATFATDRPLSVPSGQTTTAKHRTSLPRGGSGASSGRRDGRRPLPPPWPGALAPLRAWRGGAAMKSTKHCSRSCLTSSPSRLSTCLLLAILLTLYRAAGVPKRGTATHWLTLIDHAAPLPEAESRIHDRP